MRMQYVLLLKNISHCFSFSWIGPKQTISPLHNDPKQNLLAQVQQHQSLNLFYYLFDDR